MDSELRFLIKNMIRTDVPHKIYIGAHKLSFGEINEDKMIDADKVEFCTCNKVLHFATDVPPPLSVISQMLHFHPVISNDLISYFRLAMTMSMVDDFHGCASHSNMDFILNNPNEILNFLARNKNKYCFIIVKLLDGSWEIHNFIVDTELCY